jgi:hypothetical protein
VTTSAALSEVEGRAKAQVDGLSGSIEQPQVFQWFFASLISFLRHPMSKGPLRGIGRLVAAKPMRVSCEIGVDFETSL